MLGKHLGLALWIFALASGVTPDVTLAQKLRLRTSERVYQVETLDFQGVTYYRVRDLLRALDLDQEELGTQLRRKGPRGTLSIVDSRPLVRSGETYILLSSDVWRRRSEDWYVPRDFLEKALPTILERSLTRDGPNSYSVTSLDENRIRVEILKYPDHHSVVFRATRTSESEVREFRDYLEVSFEGYLVRPEMMELPSQTRLISDVDFTPQEGLGTFRIIKGPAFEYFREYQLSAPPRLVVDVYGAPDEPEVAAEIHDPPQPSRPEPGPDRPSETDRREPEPSRETDIVIDPGHGGEQYGVDVQQNILEKGIALNLARLIESRLSDMGREVVLTRTRDVSLPAEQRSSVANFHQPKAYLSLHLGAATSPQTRGPVVYVFDPPDAGAEEVSGAVPDLVEWKDAQTYFLSESRRFAHLMQSRLNQLFASENQVVSARLSVLAPVKAPAIVIETGFLTNEQDLELLSNRNFQTRLADQITDVVVRFLDTR